MIATWPSELPSKFDRKNFAAERGEGRLRSKSTLGPGKMRRRSRGVTDPITGKMTMTASQLARFLAFYDAEIGGGSLPFVFPDPMGGLPILVQWGQDPPRWSNTAGIWWELALALDKLWTGTFEPGLPALPAGRAYVTFNGTYVLSNGVPVTTGGA